MKKNKEYLKDFILIIVLIIASFLLVNPFGLIMTDELQMVVLALTCIVVITILIFLWKENPTDEREETYLLISNRIAFFAVSITLLIALIVQVFQHRIDEWIAISLCILLLSKILSIIYLKNKK